VRAAPIAGEESTRDAEREAERLEGRHSSSSVDPGHPPLDAARKREYFPVAHALPFVSPGKIGKLMKGLVVAAALLSLTGCANQGGLSKHGIPEAYQGSFHLPGQIDAINFRLADDGTFQWDIDGCDFTGGDHGRWSGAQDVTLSPDGAATMTWNQGVSYVQEITSVGLVTGSASSLSATVHDSDGSTALQTWVPGRICVSCVLTPYGYWYPDGQFACDP
jgi:hypothetical protein